ncbi:tetratricopeptide repeat protein [Teredinibacter sp. KSP-S5-2]|uniref:tetratricopeptide repeat protein n=1 Tax=Teredinibacter sp. KSP-S5-2 TaxID=3034506 RepID=UPI002934C4F2|nr:tetratricopeptide repeat protein [Teredinibacter sp. KSP-S5-2]WNO07897.1 tetratricopeptide repeat protein [Teredinibacter sp. KSP-S5-2]
MSITNRLVQTLFLAGTLCLSILVHSASAARNAIDDVDIMGISNELKTMLDDNIAPIRDKEKRAKKLHELLFNDSGLGYGIRYNATATRTAQETFDKRSGNCVSLANLFVASARYVGLKASYQAADVPEDWEEKQGFYVIPGHINVVVDLPKDSLFISRNSLRDIPSQKKMVVEFVGVYAGKNIKTKKISDDRAHAEYYNNLAMIRFATGDIKQSLAYLEKATDTYSKADFIWSNYGVVLKHKGNFDAAEKAYLKALKLNSRNLSAISNIYVLYDETQQREKALKFSKKAAKYAKKNPYYLAKLASHDAKLGNYESAIGLLHKAIHKKPTEAKFHHQIAVAYLKQKNYPKVERHLLEAEKLANSDEDMLKYQRKINAFKHLQAGL